MTRCAISQNSLSCGDISIPTIEATITLRAAPTNISTPVDREAHQAWSAARCQRLLRQLESRLTALRELTKTSDPSRKASHNANPPKNIKHGGSRRPRHTYGVKQRTLARIDRSEGVTEDSARTVRVMGSMMLAQTSTPSETYFPSPLRRRVHDQGRPAHTVPPAAVKPLGLSTSRVALDEFNTQLQPLRRILSDNQWRIYEGVLVYLDHLLRVTRADENKSCHKSLFAMCLRKVPACIEHIDAWDQQASQEPQARVSQSWTAASQEVYDQLDTLSMGGASWKLKQTIRSHAIWLLSRAIGEGLFQKLFVDVLIQLCLRYANAGEAVDLAAAMSLKKYQASGRTSRIERAQNREIFPLDLLKSAGRHGKLPGLVIDYLALLVKEKSISVHVMTKETKNILAARVESVLSSCGNMSDLRLLSTVLQALATDVDEKSYTQDSRQLGMLVSLAASLVNGVMDSPKSCVGALEKTRLWVWRIVCTTFNDAIRHLQLRPSRKRNCNLIALLVANYLAIAGSELAGGYMRREAGEKVTYVLNAANDLTLAKYRQVVVSLLCSMAYEVARMQSTTRLGHDRLVRACQLLDELALPHHFSGLQKDGAFLLALQSRNLQDLAFAEHQTLESQDTESNTIFSGWKWEEGISEWVLPSPRREIHPTSPRCEETRPEPLKSRPVQEQNQRWVSQDREEKPAPWVSCVGRGQTSCTTTESRVKRECPSNSSGWHGTGQMSAKRHRGIRRTSQSSPGPPSPPRYGVNAHVAVVEHQELAVRGRLEHKSGAKGVRSLRGSAGSGRSAQPLLSHVPTTQSLGKGSKRLPQLKSEVDPNDGRDELS